MPDRYLLLTHHLKCQLAKWKEHSISSIWGFCGLTWGSFFTHGQIKNPAFLEIAVKIHTAHLAHIWMIILALKKGWIFSYWQRWSLNRSYLTLVLGKWYWYGKFISFGQLTLPLMCVLPIYFLQKQVAVGNCIYLNV